MRIRIGPRVCDGLIDHKRPLRNKHCGSKFLRVNLLLNVTQQIRSLHNPSKIENRQSSLVNQHLVCQRIVGPLLWRLPRLVGVTFFGLSKKVRTQIVQTNSSLES